MSLDDKKLFQARQKVGANIQEARRRMGITQEQLAVQAGLDRVSIGYIEQGRRFPELRTLLHLSKTLRVPVADFFKDL